MKRKYKFGVAFGIIGFLVWFIIAWFGVFKENTAQIMYLNMGVFIVSMFVVGLLLGGKK